MICRLVALALELKRSHEFTGHPFTPVGDALFDQWSIKSAGLSAFDGRERGAYLGGFTGDGDGGMKTGFEDDGIAKSACLCAIERRLRANMMEMATTCINELLDCRRTNSKKKMLSTDVMGVFRGSHSASCCICTGARPCRPTQR